MTYVMLKYLSCSSYCELRAILITPCEVANKSVIPAVKAMLAKELIKKHGLNQNEVAELLGISQSAVSRYSNHSRGYVIKLDDIREIRPSINKIIVLLSNGLGYEKTEFLMLFCQVCTILRKKGLMCEYCRRADPTIEINECDICLK
jgi:predicted transcriptional regulator